MNRRPGIDLLFSRLRCPTCRKPVTMLFDFSDPRNFAVEFVSLFLGGIAGLGAFLWSGLWLALLIATVGGVLLTAYKLRPSEYYCSHCKASYDFTSLRAPGAKHSNP
jgi:hypothetical protein